MLIQHISDNHGYFPDLPGEFDVVVCSGDFFPYNKNQSLGKRNIELEPNRTSAKRKAEIEFQKKWLFTNIETIREWIKGKPFIWCSGNHDFLNPCQILNDYGIETIDLDNKVVEYKGLVWYGFPYIPELRNCWNFECTHDRLRKEVNIFLQRLKDAEMFHKLDIIVAHCPPNGILDMTDKEEHIGNPFINSAITYQLTNPLKLYLCGHVHPANGILSIGGTTFSNAAIGHNGKPRILEV
jgi:Icc-related predicted phosphoesterase